MARLVKYKMRHAVLHSNKTGAVPPTAFAHLTALNRKGLLIQWGKRMPCINVFQAQTADSASEFKVPRYCIGLLEFLLNRNHTLWKLGKFLTSFFFLRLPSITFFQGSVCCLHIVCDLSKLVGQCRHSSLKELEGFIHRVRRDLGRFKGVLFVLPPCKCMCFASGFQSKWRYCQTCLCSC